MNGVRLYMHHIYIHTFLAQTLLTEISSCSSSWFKSSIERPTKSWPVYHLILASISSCLCLILIISVHTCWSGFEYRNNDQNMILRFPPCKHKGLCQPTCSMSSMPTLFALQYLSMMSLMLHQCYCNTQKYGNQIMHMSVKNSHARDINPKRNYKGSNLMSCMFTETHFFWMK